MPDVARAKRIDPVQVSGNSGALAGGSEVVAVETVPAGRMDRIMAATGTYNGLPGVTTSLQLLVNGVGVAAPAFPVESGDSFDLLQGNQAVANAGDAVAIQVVGGTAADTVDFTLQAQGERA